MKRIVVSIFALAFCAGITNVALATVPDLIPVQGVLADDMDEPVDGLTDITFTLYDDAAGTTTLWTDTFTDVDVVDGFFTVYLGSDTALDFGSLISNSEVWMGIEVESDGEMNRFQLAAVPFAIEAGVCQAIGSLNESDLLTTSDPAGGISSDDVTNWNTAYGWGDHSAEGYLTDYTETDPVFDASAAAGIAAGDITSWNTAYGWGDHSVEGYLTDYTETDPIFGASAASGIASGDITNWNTAYGWGNHAGLYSPITHNHDTVYAPISHTHAWSTITSMPSGFADGTDDGPGVFITNMYPCEWCTPDAYRCGFQNELTSARTVTSYATCWNGTSITVRSASESLAAGTTVFNVEAECVGSEIVMGGGCMTSTW